MRSEPESKWEIPRPATAGDGTERGRTHSCRKTDVWEPICADWFRLEVSNGLLFLALPCATDNWRRIDWNSRFMWRWIELELQSTYLGYGSIPSSMGRRFQGCCEGGCSRIEPFGRCNPKEDLEKAKLHIFQVIQHKQTKKQINVHCSRVPFTHVKAWQK